MCTNTLIKKCDYSDRLTKTQCNHASNFSIHQLFSEDVQGTLKLVRMYVQVSYYS